MLQGLTSQHAAEKALRVFGRRKADDVVGLTRRFFAATKASYV